MRKFFRGAASSLPEGHCRPGSFSDEPGRCLSVSGKPLQGPAAASTAPRLVARSNAEPGGLASPASEDVYGAWSLSRIGPIETTWRLNLSSDSSSPAATPIS